VLQRDRHSGGLFVWHRGTDEMSFPQIKVNAQSICDFFNAPLISYGIAGRRNYRGLPTISMVFSDPDIHLADAQGPDDHIG
jgi:hypothetical protein